MRFTHLILVTWGIAVLCASLGDALSLRSGSDSGSDATQFRCIHDEIVRTRDASFDKLPIASVVPPLSNRETGASEKVRQTAAPQADEWQPIRIGVFYDDVDNASRYCSSVGQSVPDMRGGSVQCTADDILTAEKNDTVRGYVYSQIVNVNYVHLNVRRVQGNLVVPVMTSDVCDQFTIPSSHHTDGVAQTDFVLYVAAAPAPANVAAWAVTCAAGSDGRPVAGVIDISPRYLRKQQSEIQTRPILHEVMHALGFDVRLFAQQNMLTNMSVRGKPASLVMNSSNVVAKAREQYGCDTLTYMELEDETSQSDGNSHWKRRNAKEELMAGIVGIGYYTNLTIAAMEDTGFYKGNYGNAELMPWGYQAGCNLLDEKCVIDGVSQEPSMFCTNTDTARCTSDRLSIGICGIQSGGKPLPDYYQYFADPTEGGTAQYMDHCPVVEQSGQMNCVTGDASAMPGSVSGADARCFDSPADIALGNLQVTQAICAHVGCNYLASTYQIQVQGAPDFVACPVGGTVDLHAASLQIFQSGTIACPSFTSVCQFIPYTTSSSDNDDGGTKNIKKVLIIAIVVPIVGVLVLVGVGILIWRLCVRHRKRSAARQAATSQIIEVAS